MSEWIPTADRLPDIPDAGIGEEYIVTHVEDADPPQFHIYVALWDGECFWADGDPLLRSITAWMPCPSPFEVLP